MLYTLTLNPAIDLFIDLNELLPKKVNRSNYDDYQENGKGVNVSRILHRLEIENTALGFIAGFTGNFIKDKLEESGIKTNFIEVDGITRVNVFLNAETEYKIVNKGPLIPEEKKIELLNQLIFYKVEIISLYVEVYLEELIFLSMKKLLKSVKIIILN